MKTRRSSLMLIALLVAGIAYAQDTASFAATAEAQAAAPEAPPKPEPPEAPVKPEPPQPEVPGEKQAELPLEVVIERALTSSPEIQIAEAQLREAEARLKQVRTEVAQKALTAFHDRLKTEQTIEETRKALEELKAVADSDLKAAPALMEMQQRLAQAQAELARQDVALRGLENPETVIVSRVGRGDTGMGQDRSRLFRGPRIQRPRPRLEDMPESETAKLLEALVSLEFEDRALAEIFGYVRDYFGLNVVLDANLQKAQYPGKIQLDDVRLRDALLAMAESFGDMVFLVRDYGVFVTTRENAETIAAPSIPENVPLYVPADELMGQVGGFGGGFTMGGGGTVGDFGGGAVGGGGGVGRNAPGPTPTRESVPDDR